MSIFENLNKEGVSRIQHDQRGEVKCIKKRKDCKFAEEKEKDNWCEDCKEFWYDNGGKKIEERLRKKKTRPKTKEMVKINI